MAYTLDLLSAKYFRKTDEHVLALTLGSEQLEITKKLVSTSGTMTDEINLRLV